MIRRREFIRLLSALPVIGKAFDPEWHSNDRQTSEKAWTQFTRDLADALADLEEDDYLIVAKKTGWCYVQFAAQGSDGVRAEAVSNGYLDEEHKLSEEACRRLLRWWNAPTYQPGHFDPDTDDPHGSPNYFIDAAAPLHYGSVANLAVATLREVFGIKSPEELQYKAFPRVGRSDIRFPHLRIVRERRTIRTAA